MERPIGRGDVASSDDVGGVGGCAGAFACGVRAKIASRICAVVRGTGSLRIGLRRPLVVVNRHGSTRQIIGVSGKKEQASESVGTFTKWNIGSLVPAAYVAVGRLPTSMTRGVRRRAGEDLRQQEGDLGAHEGVRRLGPPCALSRRDGARPRRPPLGTVPPVGHGAVAQEDSRRSWRIIANAEAFWEALDVDNRNYCAYTKHNSPRTAVLGAGPPQGGLCCYPCLAQCM